MNKNKKSFAQRAKEIANRYKRAKFDKAEREELDAALAALAQEQEAYKQANGIGEYSPENIQAQQMQQMEDIQQFAGGGYINYKPGWTNGNTVTPSFNYGELNNLDYSQPNYKLNYVDYKPHVESMFIPPKTEYLQGYDKQIEELDAIKGLINKNSQIYNYDTFKNTLPTLFKPTSNITPTDVLTTNILAKKNVLPEITVTGKSGFTNPTTEYLTDYDNEIKALDFIKNQTNPDKQNGLKTTLGSTQGILPSLLGGAASMVGNMIMSAGTKPIELKSSYTPEQISLARQRERLSREAGTAQNVAMRGLRESGNRGAYLSGVGNVATGVSRGLSDSLTQSYMSEEMANLEQRNKAQDYQKQVDMANWQARQQAVNDKRAYQSAAISTIPSVMTDINRIQGQNALLESLGSQNYMIAPSTNKAWKDKLLGRTLYGTVRK